MKRLVIMTVLVSMAVTGRAQTGDEWFSQKKTQRKYLAEQIAALQVYIEYGKKGYDIARKGLTTISNIKNGDFNMHRDFFSSMEYVNPAIKNYAKVADIIALQVMIVTYYQRNYNQLKNDGNLKPAELEYIYRVYGRLLDDCGRLIDELIILSKDAQVEMKDDERMQRIDGLYTEMQENYTFCREFGNATESLALSRESELKHIERTRAWNGLNND